MAKFRTELFPGQSPLSIAHHNQLLTIGSCFADVIGSQLKQNKFQVFANPYGVLYHPEAIFNLLKLDTSTYSSHFVEREGLWFNYSFHSELYATSLHELNERAGEISSKLIDYLRSCKIIIITMGTAWAHRYKDSGNVTGNCHRMPLHLFTRELTSPHQIVGSFDEMNKRLKEINPSLEFILTVSPVRHTKETLILNTVSKSSLRLACHHLEEKHAHVHYFPAYEIQMDDLRDYRFYKEDMIHPTAEAEKYIWEKFQDTFFSKATKQLVEKWGEVLKAINHKPFHPEAPAHKKFLMETIKKMQELGKFIPVDDELLYLHQQLDK